MKLKEDFKLLLDFIKNNKVVAVVFLSFVFFVMVFAFQKNSIKRVGLGEAGESGGQSDIVANEGEETIDLEELDEKSQNVADAIEAIVDILERDDKEYILSDKLRGYLESLLGDLQSGNMEIGDNPEDFKDFVKNILDNIPTDEGGVSKAEDISAVLDAFEQYMETYDS
ncbi:MAG: hypothetical protein GF347_03630, partial [Candidatus Moranbacteria bacterium]|nr:hypothetical protein [Candidatus Moranbacteria bacterium]